MRKKKIIISIAVVSAGLVLTGCGTISTFQTGKTVPQGKFSFGMGTSGGLLRTKSNIVGFPIELGYGAAEIFFGYGVFDFLELDIKGMAAMFTNKEDFKHLSGIPAFGGGQARVAITQERWGFPFSTALGMGYYAGNVQSRQTNTQNQEVKRNITVIRDRVISLYASRDIVSWLTLYGSYKTYERSTNNRRYDFGQLTNSEVLSDLMRGWGGGISFNVGSSRNTHIMFEVNSLKDKDEPEKHYQKQTGIGMSVEF